jgi:hypothetical protein
MRIVRVETKKVAITTTSFFISVRMEGLEPPYLAASDPKSDVSTNFTTCAFLVPGSMFLVLS